MGCDDICVVFIIEMIPKLLIKKLYSAKTNTVSARGERERVFKSNLHTFNGKTFISNYMVARNAA